MMAPSLRADERAGPALEFALVAPALFVFIFGMFGIYSVSSAKRAMDFGVERALRYAAIHSGSSTSSVVSAYCAAAIIVNGDVGGSSKCTSTNVTVTPSSFAAGDTVLVVATYAWSPPAGYTTNQTAQFSSMSLTASGSVRVLH